MNTENVSPAKATGAILAVYAVLNSALGECKVFPAYYAACVREKVATVGLWR